MEFLLFLVLGALAGWIASMIMGTNPKQGLLLDIVVGIIGAFIGGVVMQFFGQPGAGGFNLYSVLVAIMGSVVLLAVYRAVRRV